ncbi:hypothetical protein SLA2020_290810 [Shorea laevis]
MGISALIAGFGNSTWLRHFAVSVAAAIFVVVAAVAGGEEGEGEKKFAKFAVAAVGYAVAVEGQGRKKDEKEEKGMGFEARDCWDCCFEEELLMSSELVFVLSLKLESGWRSPSLTNSVWPPMMGPSTGLGIGGVSGRRTRKPFPPP